MYSVMLADDENLERQGWRRIIEKHCSERVRVVAEAKTGREAVEQAKKTKPDIILMDVKMPGINGIRASKLIREFLPTVRIVVISAYDEFSYAQEALKVGAVSYLLKPVQPVEVVDIISKQIEELEKERRQREEEEALRAMVQKMIPYIKLGFVFEWLAGNMMDATEIRERAEFLGIKQLPQVVMVINIDNFLQYTRGKEEVERQVLKQKVFEKIAAITEEWHQSVCVPLQGDKYGVLVAPRLGEGPEELRKRTARLAEAIRRQIEEDPFIPVTVTIGIGRVYPDVTCLHMSYKEAQRALEHKLFTGGNQVIHIDDVLPFDERIHCYPFALEKELMLNVRIGNVERARQCLEKLLNELFSRANDHPGVLKTRILELLLVLSRQATESGANPEEVARQSFEYFRELEEEENSNELREWTIDKVEHLIKLVEEARSLRCQDIMKKVLAYIHQNYNRDLSLEEVAGAVYISPCYLSRIFKQTQGVNFIDYLTSVRLENAKHLLRTTSESIAEIAKKVGYRDPKYFSRVFKRYEGCSPGEYRKGNFSTVVGERQ